MASLACSLITPDGPFLDEAEADFVVFPGADGEIGVLPRHASMVGKVGVGEVRVRTGSETLRFLVSGGFSQVREDRVLILTQSVEEVAKIDEVRAREALAAARSHEEALLARWRLRLLARR